MIFVSVHALDPERWVFLAGFKEYFLEFLQHVGFEYLSAVLSAPYNMVLMLVRRVI